MLGSFLLAAAVVVAGSVLGVLAALTPLETSRALEQAHYQHNLELDYTAIMVPSVLYPDGVAQSGSQTAKTAGPSTREPLYVKPLRHLTLHARYRLDSDEPAKVSWALQTEVQLKAPDGWSKKVNAAAPAPLEGSPARVDVNLDVPAILAMIERIEKEIEFKPPYYEVLIQPTVTVKGDIGGAPIEETYSPSFVFKLNRTQLLLDPQLEQHESKVFSLSQREEQRLHLAGASLSVRDARLWTVAALAIAGPSALALGASIFLGWGRGEAARIATRYAGLIVSVRENETKAPVQVVRVEFIADLARVAERHGSVILHSEGSGGSHRYSVNADLCCYEFQLIDRAHDATRKPVFQGA
jgi:hypothetical protein